MASLTEVEVVVAWSRDVHALGVELLKAARTASSPLPIPMMMASRAMNALDSVQLLVEQGHTTDAFAAMRTICELAIDVAYIRQGDTEARMDLFANYLFVAQYRMMKALGEAHFAPAEVQRLGALYEQLKGNYPTKSSWCGRSIKQRADDAGKTYLYELAHRLGSGAAHSCAEALWHESSLVSRDGQQTIVSRVADYSRRDPTPLKIATAALIDLLLSIAGLLGLESFAPRFAAMLKRSPVGATFAQTMSADLVSKAEGVGDEE